MRPVSYFGDPRLSGRIVAVLFLALASCATTRGACDGDDPIRTVCGFENPEDLAVVPEHDGVIVSQMRRDGAGGNLSVWSEGEGKPRRLWPLETTPGIDGGPAAGDPACPPPAPDQFAPHGIFVAPSGLYVVNHGGRESVEIFALDRSAQRLGARWLGCIELPAGTSANDVAVGPRGEVVVSNMSPPGELIWAALKSQLGMSTGDVLLWRAGAGWEHVANTAAGLPNGVAISADGAWLYYAESGASRVVRIRPDGSGRAEVELDGRPDNLAWGPSGALSVAASSSFWDLAVCALRQPCRASWKVFEIDPARLEAREVLKHSGERMGAVATAQPAGERIYLSAVFDDRIGVWSSNGAR